MNNKSLRITPINQKIPSAENGVVCSYPQEFFGYFGWASITKMDNGDLIVVASGLRNAHVCPFGRTVLLRSKDEGRSWTSPRVINDTPLDDRDAGVVSLGGSTLLVTMFTSDNRKYMDYQDYQEHTAEFNQRYEAMLRWVDDETAKRWLGSWVRVSKDNGETWEGFLRAPVNTPHGPIRLEDNRLLYFGKSWEEGLSKGKIIAYQSRDQGKSWQPLGEVPLFPGTQPENYHEPHLVELPGNVLLGHIRVENHTGTKLETLGIENFSIMQTISKDGGKTWSIPEPFNFHGSPPHLLRHSSGALICVYGYRQKPYGERAMISLDNGSTWTIHHILRDDAPDWDLGYPASVELSDGSIFTIYYQKINTEREKCSLLWTRWNLPD